MGAVNGRAMGGLTAALQLVATASSNACSAAAREHGFRAGVRGHAVAALGKVCLRNGAIAQKTVEFFVLHLQNHEPLQVRGCAAIVLGDLCKHNACNVERFIPQLTLLFADKVPLLRKQAAAVVASLLADGLLKFRGSLTFRFLFLLGDPSQEVRGLAEAAVKRVLHRSHPKALSQHFADAICAFNCWGGLGTLEQFDPGFSLQDAPERRALIYRFMLCIMDQEQRFAAFAQLVATLLAHFAEEAERLPSTMVEPAGQVLADTLALIGCRELRCCLATVPMQGAGGCRGDQDGSELVDHAASQGSSQEQAVRNRALLTVLLRKNTRENVAPVLGKLRSVMERTGSPFLDKLYKCLELLPADCRRELTEPMLALQNASPPESQTSCVAVDSVKASGPSSRRVPKRVAGGSRKLQATPRNTKRAKLQVVAS